MLRESRPVGQLLRVRAKSRVPWSLRPGAALRVRAECFVSLVP